MKNEQDMKNDFDENWGWLERELMQHSMMQHSMRYLEDDRNSLRRRLGGGNKNRAASIADLEWLERELSLSY